MTRRFQFSVSSLLLLVTLIAVSLAAIIQVPHVFVFALGLAAVVFASRTAYRQSRNALPRLHVLLALIAAWLVFYALSLGPFIFLSEIERKITGYYHLGRLASVYRPAIAFNHWRPFRWYVTPWIPPDAVGLHRLYPAKISPELVGTWQVEQDAGHRVILRADGTGLAPFSPPQQQIYFEWTSDANEFALYQYSSKRSVSAWFGRVLMDSAPTDTEDLIERSPTHFKLRHKNGTTSLLTRTQDNTLEPGQ